MHNEYFVVRRGNSEWRVSMAGHQQASMYPRTWQRARCDRLGESGLRPQHPREGYVEEGLLGGLTVVYDSTTGTGALPNE